MDHHDGGYGYPPYEEDPRAAGQNQGSPRAYRDDPAAFGSDPSQQYDYQANAYDPNYPTGSQGYQERGYSARSGQPGYADADNPYAPRPIDPNYGYDYPQQTGGYASQQEYDTQPSAGNDFSGQRSTGRVYNDPDSAYATRRQGAEYTQYGTTGRTSMPQDGSGQSSHIRGNTGRTSMPQGDESYGYGARGTTSRTRMPEDVEEYSPRGNTTRTRYPQSDDRYVRDSGDDMDLYERPRSSGKKKRSKFGKFMHALGLYLAQLPAKTLVIIGGTFAMALVAVILLAVLLPNSSRTERPDDGQLGITDITPTPTVAPTDTPAPTEAVTPTPALPVLTENIVNAGTISDLIPDIQKRLVELGYMEEPSGGYTNKYGPTTKTAIRLFQVKNFDDSKNWDGIIGNGTYALLMSDQAKAYYLTRGDGDDRTKVITKLVEDVTKLQNRLIELGYLTPGSATGLYGNTTVQAVQKFQEYHGLSPIDGKAGQETLKMIYSTEAMDATTGKANNKSKMTPTPSVSPGTGATTSTSPSVSPTTSPTLAP